MKTKTKLFAIIGGILLICLIAATIIFFVNRTPNYNNYDRVGMGDLEEGYSEEGYLASVGYVGSIESVAVIYRWGDKSIDVAYAVYDHQGRGYDLTSTPYLLINGKPMKAVSEMPGNNIPGEIYANIARFEFDVNGLEYGKDWLGFQIACDGLKTLFNASELSC